MIKPRESVIDRVVSQFGQCLTSDAANRIAALRVDPDMQGRIDYLAELNAEGDITSDDKAELEAYVSAAAFLSVLQAEARRIVRDRADT